MKACMAGNDSSCESSWDVYVMKCNDSSVAYLPNNMNECGRYCMGRLKAFSENKNFLDSFSIFNINFY